MQCSGVCTVTGRLTIFKVLWSQGRFIALHPYNKHVEPAESIVSVALVLAHHNTDRNSEFP